jgi:proteasome lid subunit RPN8/RPN11
MAEEKRGRLPRRAPPAETLRRIIMVESAFNEIKSTVGRFPAETGGALLGDPATFVVTGFIFDESSFKNRKRAVYQPDTSFLNQVIEASSDEFLGIAHSHPPRVCWPSGPDEDAA